MAIRTAFNPKTTGIIRSGNAAFSTAPFTICGWFVLTTDINIHPDGYGRISVVAGLFPAARVSIVNNGGNQLRYELIDVPGVSWIVNADNFIIKNILYHFAATADPGLNMLLYVDGTKQAGAAIAPSIYPASDAFCIGIDGDTTKGGFPGVIDDLRFYTRCLPANEIETIRNGQGHDGIEYGLFSRYAFQNN